MHAMRKARKFKYIYLMATLYVFTLTIPSAVSVYWAFGDELLTHANASSLLPQSPWRDAAVILMLIHQVCLVDILVSKFNFGVGLVRKYYCFKFWICLVSLSTFGFG